MTDWVSSQGRVTYNFFLQDGFQGTYEAPREDATLVLYENLKLTEINALKLKTEIHCTVSM